jgi:eukaryotic-like serine/threonine-protein kinase
LPNDPNLETQPTVITKTPSLAHYPLSGLHPRDMGRLLEGERLGHFDLLEYVGGGGMGAVFRALDTMLNRTVAVKVLSQDQSSDEETLRRFQNEAQSAARLDHENISRVYYVGEDRGWHYIVFEFIEGINLRDSVEQRGPLPLFDAVSYTLQITDALLHASHRDVVHRDIKPSNVLITPDGRAKLVDMGLARLHQVEPQGNDLTASGVTLGTFDYISPEQARDPRSADVRSDIYSLGCTLYFMLTARPPFPDGTVLQKLLQHQGDEPPDVRTFRSDLPDDFLAILNRMLAKSPDKRFQSPAELVGELNAFATRHGLQPASAGNAAWLAPTPTPLSFWERHLPWMVPMAVLILLVAILSQIWARSGDQSHPPPLQSATATSGASLHPGATESNGQITSPQYPSSTRIDSRIDPHSTAVAPLPPARERPGNATTQSPVDAAPMEHLSSPPTVGQRSPITSAASGLIESVSEWQNDMRALLSDGFRREQLAGWWPAGQTVPFSAGSRPATTSTSSAAGSPNSKRTTTDPPASSISNPGTTGGVDGVLVVGGSQATVGEYSSLTAACDAAKTGDIIELRFNGRIDERPIRLGNLKLTIRAADGYQPVVRFRSQDQYAAESGRSAVVVAGGNLSLLGISIEFEVPRDLPADDWTLFELRQPEAVRLESCTLTIRNTTAAGAMLHPDVAFFRVRASGAGMNPLSNEKNPRTARTAPLTLQIRNSVARGAATLLEDESPLALSLQWDNGIFASGQRMLTMFGTADPPPDGTTVQIDLRHVTALTSRGLLEMNANGDTPYLPPVDVNASDSILLVSGKSPLVTQAGDDELEQLRKRLSWKGDRLFYEGVVTFWRVANTENVEDYAAKQWQTFWGEHDQHPHYGDATWQVTNLENVDRNDFQRLTPADFKLRPGENPARRGGSDGRDAGCQLDLLPTSVREPARAESP